MTSASDDGEDSPTNPHIEVPSRTHAVEALRASAPPPAGTGFTPRAPMLPRGGATPSQRPPALPSSSAAGAARPSLGAAPGGRPSLGAAGGPTTTASSTGASGSGGTAAPVGPAASPAAPPAPSPAPVRTSTLPGAAAFDRASSPPLSSSGFLIPKPTGGEPADPWRERLAALDVQAQATRALAQRTADDALAMRTRAEAAESKVRALEAELGGRVAALEQASAMRSSVAASAPGDTAGSSAPPEGLVERLERVDRLAAQARAALDTVHHDLSEHARLFEARKARLDSMDARLRALESDPRFAELARKVEAFDLTLSRLLPQLERAASAGDAVARLEEAQARAATRQAELEATFGARLGASEHAGAGAAAMAALAAEIEGLRERVAQLEAEPAAVRTSGSSGSRGAKKADDELLAVKGIGPKLARSLRELGVSTVAQIAAWDDGDVAAFAEKLGTTVAKIRKAGWVEAARAAAVAASS